VLFFNGLAEVFAEIIPEDIEIVDVCVDPQQDPGAEGKTDGPAAGGVKGSLPGESKQEENGGQPVDISIDRMSEDGTARGQIDGAADNDPSAWTPEFLPAGPYFRTDVPSGDAGEFDLELSGIRFRIHQESFDPAQPVGVLRGNVEIIIMVAALDRKPDAFWRVELGIIMDRPEEAGGPFLFALDPEHQGIVFRGIDGQLGALEIRHVWDGVEGDGDFLGKTRQGDE